jgi:hypothetical protein
VTQVELAAGCPVCGSQQARPIVWGLPTDDERDRTDVVFGGCCLPDQPAAWSCDSCGHEWGTRD